MDSYVLYGLAIIIVTISAITDIRKQIIYIWPVIIASVFAIIIRLFIVGNIKSAIMGACVGICFLIGSRLTKQAIGYGDGLVILFLGLCLGFNQCISVCLACLFLISLVMIALLVLKRVQRKTAIPVMPWLLVALVAGGVLW